MPRIGFITLCIVLLVMRDGFWLYSTDWEGIEKQLALFPEAVSWQTYSWGNVVLAKALGVEGPEAWYALHGLLTLLVIVIPVVWAWRRPAGEFHLQVVFWFLVPMVSGLLMWIGMYDVVFGLGVVILALSRRWYLVVIGALILSAGNPEQAVVACVIYVCASLATMLADRRLPAAIALATTCIAFIPVYLWQQSQETDGRSAYLNSPMVGIKFLIDSWPHSIWGWFGILWFLVIVIFLSLAGRDRWILLLSLVVLPGLITLMVNDWNRVFWLMSTLPLLVVAERWIQRRSGGVQGSMLLVLGLAALAITPPANGGLHFVLAAAVNAARALIA